jgi:hypothetical protein
MSEYPKYSKGAYSSILGLAVMRQKSATENSQMIASIFLCEKEAGELADALIATLTRSESPVEKATGEMYKALEARQEADAAWKNDKTAHNVCHEMTKKAEEFARTALAAYDAVKEGK